MDLPLFTFDYGSLLRLLHHSNYWYPSKQEVSQVCQLYIHYATNIYSYPVNNIYNQKLVKRDISLVKQQFAMENQHFRASKSTNSMAIVNNKVSNYQRVISCLIAIVSIILHSEIQWMFRQTEAIAYGYFKHSYGSAHRNRLSILIYLAIKWCLAHIHVSSCYIITIKSIPLNHNEIQ